MVNIPFPMASLNKIKPDDPFLDKWLLSYKGPYVISDKLDGISAQIYNDPKKGLKMYTRGEMTDTGNIGQDITYLLKFIDVNTENIPSNVSIRGELIIPKKDFKNADTKYKNIRNAVGGLITSKKSFNKDLAKLVKFVSYSIIFPEYKQEEQMKLLKKYKLETVEYKVEKKINEKMLMEYLQLRRKSSEFDVDGIVIVDSSDSYKVLPNNPQYAFAFKMVLDDQYTEAIVKEVRWEPTMDSYLKPIVEIEPVELVGTTVSRATAHNAKMVIDNKINKGAKIKIIRSGDVIPYIMEVTKPAKNASVPDIPYKFNETEVDFIIDYTKKIPKEVLAQVNIKINLHFFRKIGVKFLSDGIITKLYNEGYHTIQSIIGAEEKDLYHIEGLGKKMVDKIYKEIYNALDNCDLILFMAASHMDRGLGERKIKEIINKYPNLMNEKWSKEEFIEKIKEVDGFSDKLAERFTLSFKEFKNFYNKIDEVYDMSHILKVKISEKEGTLFDGKSICFTGFRDNIMEEFIIKNGGKISSSVSSKTYMLVYKDDSAKDSSKYLNAEKYSIKILSKDEFKKKYL
jgi:NAD-dependent DNA ligase